MEKYSSNSRPRKTDLRVFVPGWVRDLLPRLKGAALPIWLSYCSHANLEGLAWPSIRLLSKETGYGEKAVKQARALLVEGGLLVPQAQDRPERGRFGRKVFRVITSYRGVEKTLRRHRRVAHRRAVDRRVVDRRVEKGLLRFNHRKVNHRKVCQGSKSQQGLRRTAVPSRGTGRLEESIARKLATGRGDLPLKRVIAALDRSWVEDLQRAYAALRYELDVNDPTVGAGFAETLADVYREHADKDVKPGILACRVLDRCEREGFLFPPTFLAHRDRLRAAERATEGDGQKVEG